MSDKEESRPAPRRLAYLDGLRGTAALMVVFHHFIAAFIYSRGAECPLLFQWLTKTPLSLLDNGRICVFIFFVLSGFVLSESVAKGRSSLPARLVARYLRLTVPMVTSLVFAWILLKLFTETRLEAFKLDSYGFLQKSVVFGANMPGFSRPFLDGFINVYRFGASDLNDVVWTMKKELIGSYAIYVLYRFFPRPYLWAALVVFLGIACLGPDYLGFPIGAIFREIWAAGKMRGSVIGSWLAVLVAVVVARNGHLDLVPTAGPGYSLFTDFIFKHQSCLYSVAAGLLVYSILTLPALQRLLSTPLPQFLGRISFALYLVHLPIICSVILWCDLHMTWPFYPKISAMFILLIALSFAAAWLLTVAVDEPLTSRLHYLKRLSWQEVSKWWSQYFAKPASDDRNSKS